MNKIKLVFLFLCLSMLISCAQFNSAVNMSTNSRDYLQKFPGLDRPRGIQNAKAEPNVGDEKAVVVTVYSRGNYYIGMDQFSIEDIQSKIERKYADAPAQKGKIYFNANNSADYGDVVRMLDIFRKLPAEEIGLIVDPAAKNDSPYNILKIKLFPEPKETDTFENAEMFKHPVLEMKKDGTISFAKYDKYELKPEKPEIKKDEDDAKIQQLIKDKGAKTISIKIPRSESYGRIARLVDAAYSAGVTTVYLMIDDLYQ